MPGAAARIRGRAWPGPLSRLRALALLAAAVLALSVVLLPWYALGAYVATGWEATWWARVALALALAVVLTVRLGGPAALGPALAAVALLLVAVRAAAPPDFGFDFDGLAVPVERRFGLWVALAAAAVLALAEGLSLFSGAARGEGGRRSA